MKNHSDYLIFVDESGDHNLQGHDPKYPVFILAFLVIEKSHYCDFLLPEFTKLKLKYFPTDNIIFHEREIRKKAHYFSFLQDPDKFESLINDLNYLIDKTDFSFVATSIRKDNFYKFLEEKNLTTDRYFAGVISANQHPYKISSMLCVEMSRRFLMQRESENKKAVITFESRGKKEDAEMKKDCLELAKTFYNFDFDMITKNANSLGLQMVDLIARPIGIHLLNPSQKNRAFEILNKKTFSISQLWVN